MLTAEEIPKKKIVQNHRFIYKWIRNFIILRPKYVVLSMWTEIFYWLTSHSTHFGSKPFEKLNDGECWQFKLWTWNNIFINIFDDSISMLRCGFVVGFLFFCFWHEMKWPISSNARPHCFDSYNSSTSLNNKIP